MDSDQQLLAARELDPVLLAEIHDRYYPVVYRYVHFRLEDADACEDIAGDVFLRLIDAVKKHKGPTQNLRGWLLGTASHLISDHLRARYHYPTSSLEDLELPLPLASPEDEADQSTQLQVVQQAIQHLTSEQQNVLALRFAEEYSLEETAQVMGKTVGAIKLLQFRALASLRRLLVAKERL